MKRKMIQTLKPMRSERHEPNRHRPFRLFHYIWKHFPKRNNHEQDHIPVPAWIDLGIR